MRGYFSGNMNQTLILANPITRKVFIALSVMAFMLLWNTTCLASVCIKLDLKRDSVNADIICVGRVVTSNSEKDGYVVAEFAVDRVIKGTLVSGSPIRIVYPRGQQHLWGHDLVLLKRQDESYEFSRPEGSMAVSDISRSIYRQSDSIMDNLRWETINSLQDSSEWVVRSAMDQSSLLLSGDVNDYILPRINDANNEIRAMALRACIAAGIDSAIIPALELVERAETDAKNQESRVPITLVVEIRQFIIHPEMVTAVASKLASKCDMVRRLASFVLRQSRLSSALPCLQKALDDPDSEVRYNAVMGIALAVGDFSHAPSFDKFRESEDAYLSYWKTHVYSQK